MPTWRDKYGEGAAAFAELSAIATANHLRTFAYEYVMRDLSFAPSLAPRTVIDLAAWYPGRCH